MRERERGRETNKTGKRSRLREKEGWSAELVQAASVSRVSSEEGVDGLEEFSVSQMSEKLV